MKIEADLLSVRQDWNPSTNVQSNVIVLKIFGVTVEVPVSPEQVQALIRRAAAGPGHSPLPPGHPDAGPVSAELETWGEGEDEEFGGDFALNDESRPTKAPVMFQQSPNLEEVLAGFDEPAKPAPLSATAQRDAAIAAKRSRDPAQVRKENKLAMRERANATPARRVARDDMGYPIIDERARPSAPRPAGPVEGPEIVRSTATAQLETGNDGFEQG